MPRSPLLAHLDKVYEPQFRLIDELRFEGLHTRGTFLIPEKSYTYFKTRELSAASFILLWNQIMFTTIVSGLQSKRYIELQSLDLADEKAIEFGSTCVVRKIDAISFNQMVTPYDNPLTFDMEMTRVINKLHSSKLIFFKSRLSLCHGKHTGSGTFCHYAGTEDELHNLGKK